MNVKPTPFPELTLVNKVTRIIVTIAGEMVLAAGINLMALVVLVLLVLPGGVEGLAVEGERIKRCIHHTRAFLFGKHQLLTKQSL